MPSPTSSLPADAQPKAALEPADAESVQEPEEELAASTSGGSGAAAAVADAGSCIAEEQPPEEEDAASISDDEPLTLAATELQGLQLGRQLSDASIDSASEASASGGDGEGALFANQDEPPIVAPEVAELSQAGQGAAAAQLAATLRSASLAQQAGSAAGEASLGSQPKHVFVFSTAGKPIYAYHRDEAAQAGLCATAEAILSVAHSKGHTLRHVRAGRHVFAFLERPPLCLVGVSALAEPPAVLRMQLSLVHGQIVSLLTSSALRALFARKPGYDARKLLGGSEGMLAALIDSFTAAPAALLGAYPCLPLLGGVRQALLASLAAAVKATNAVHGLVVAGGQVAAACPARGTAPLQQWDVLLLLNLLGANESFRHSGEAMTPVCLPRYNSAANLHAYIRYADAASQTATVLLCGGMPDLGALAAAQQRMQQQLEAVGALQALVQSAAQELGVAGQGQQGSSGAALLAVPALPPAAGGGRFGATPLLHFVYKHAARQQYVMSPFSPPLLAGGMQQPLIVAYSQLRAAMFESSSGTGGPLQRLRFEARPRFVLLGAVSGEAELFLAFDPLTDKSEAAGVCSRLGMWLHARHDMLFF